MIGIFFGDKRALYLGLTVTLLVYFLFHKFKEKRPTLLKIIFVFYIAAAFIYLILIKTGVFEALLYKYGINDMSRLTFWNYFSSAYEISPFYWGRGIAIQIILWARQKQKPIWPTPGRLQPNIRSGSTSPPEVFFVLRNHRPASSVPGFWKLGTVNAAHRKSATP